MRSEMNMRTMKYTSTLPTMHSNYQSETQKVAQASVHVQAAAGAVQLVRRQAGLRRPS
jgi:hypothetical protein